MSRLGQPKLGQAVFVQFHRLMIAPLHVQIRRCKYLRSNQYAISADDDDGEVAFPRLGEHYHLTHVGLAAYTLLLSITVDMLQDDT